MIEADVIMGKETVSSFGIPSVGLVTPANGGRKVRHPWYDAAYRSRLAFGLRRWGRVLVLRITTGHGATGTLTRFRTSGLYGPWAWRCRATAGSDSGGSRSGSAVIWPGTRGYDVDCDRAFRQFSEENRGQGQVLTPGWTPPPAVDAMDLSSTRGDKKGLDRGNGRGGKSESINVALRCHRRVCRNCYWQLRTSDRQGTL